MISSVAFLLGVGLVLMTIQMSVLWLVHLRLRNAAVVDVGWAAGLAVLAFLYAAFSHAPKSRLLLLCGLVGIWAFRLSYHLYRDRVAGWPEEGRYRTLRASWGDKAALYFWFFFTGQGVLNVLLSIPFLFITLNLQSKVSSLEWTGAGLWALAVCGESLADRQLKAFKKDPRNRAQVCRVGLWNYSRHPNYFCEWLIWCSYALMATAASSGWLAWLSPVIILFLLLKVSGIPPTEKQSLKSRGDLYREYQRTTPAFFPWFPKQTVRSDSK